MDADQREKSRSEVCISSNAEASTLAGLLVGASVVPQVRMAGLREPLADLGRRIFNAINVPFGLEVVITQHDKLNKGQE